NDILKSMGAGRAFADNNSDFDSMMQNVPDPLKIDAALQKAIIEVDEKGTEAAAATAIMVGETMALGEPEPIVEFKADKPFTYYIKDNASGETLFAGRYVKAE
ncbi:MAG: serpin family protein, partial [Clostridia bacterium]|nr:serpin family protein [Clostridia bacterium]